MNCTIPYCNLKYYAKGFCHKHYAKNKNYGDPLFERVCRNQFPCEAGNCDKKVFANGLCQTHNARRKRHGDPNYINPKCNRDGNYIKRARAKSAQWKKDNREKNNAFNACRKKRVKQATPSWVNMEEIYKIYLNRPEGYHVDHIIPINGKDVSGLHVPWNLQYLPKAENLSKSNKSFPYPKRES
jgi:hypothetical protein